ncbi:MAG: MrcB family domain-containing protein [Deferrisomatales bacterium]
MGVYATSNQGVTVPSRGRGRKAARQALRERARELRAWCAEAGSRGFSLENDTALRADAGLGSDYESSTIAHRLYPAGQVPDDSELLADLEAVLTAYDRYLAQREQAIEPPAGDPGTPEGPGPVPGWARCEA